MRPLKLSMTAFGPYKEKETIDFTKLGDYRLFVISGNTGAGKTTIFDAICYALYDSASGEDRSETRLLRSHFADDQTPTTVEFEFAAGRKTFVVLRQLAYRKSGNKSETPPRAELYETTDGKREPCVDRFVIGDINQKLLSIVGLTKEQFSQIVMLPQGEFRKLLTSDTENKEEVLRRIFRTELFQKVEERFNELRRGSREQLDRTKAELDAAVRQLPALLPLREDGELARTLAQEHRNAAQLLAGIDAELAHIGLQKEEAESGRAVLDREAAAQTEHYHLAEALNGQFAELEALHSRKRALDGRLPEIEAEERRAVWAERAIGIEPYELERSRLRRQREDAAAKLEQRQLQAAEADRELQAAESRYAVEEKRDGERKDAEQQLRRLSDMLPVVQSLQQRREALARLQAEEKAAAESVAQLEAACAAKTSLKADLDKQLKELERTTAELPAKHSLLSELRVRAALMKDVVELQAQLELHRKLEHEERLKLREAAELHRKLENAWVEGQASLLASHLHDGEACPVCGSPDHPHKASASDVVPSREQLNEAKERLRLAEEQCSRATAQAAAASDGIGNKRTQLAEAGFQSDDVRSSYEQLVVEGKRLRAEVAQLEAQEQRKRELKTERERLDAELTKLAEGKQRAADLRVQLSLDRTAQETALDKDTAAVPEELRSAASLRQRLDELTKLAGAMEAAWKQAQEQRSAATRRQAELAAIVSQMTEQLAETAGLQAEAEERFASALAAAGFPDEAGYGSAKLSRPDIEALKTGIETYRQTAAAVAVQIADLERRLEGKQRQDTAALAAELERLKTELDRLAGRVQELKSYYTVAETMKRTIMDGHERYRQLEERYGTIADVYEAMKGNNPLRMSFERYILIEYLEQILQAANARLHKLSGGQFVLQRSERIERHNRPSGLGLDVYDAYTGQNRDVKTLSGGEKFNASLCLALGMTDVIQANQGGVQIDMMFIDEGFGTLDEESLGKAIETLVELQRAGRMIGVISHVPEIKAAFPAILEVRKTREGHSRTELILK